MNTILDYLATEFASFEEKPFCPVDSLILSQLCMVKVDQIVPSLEEKRSFLNINTIVENLLSSTHRAVHFRDMLRVEHYHEMFTGLVPECVKENLIALAASPRFRDVVVQDILSLFDIEKLTQFAAMTFVYKNRFAYVGFRGTDSSFTGWKEDFNMAFTWPVPSQEQAVRYVETVVKRLPKTVMLGGHSKGGNLAVYAAIKVDPKIQERITQVYNHDGPGFRPAAFSETEYDLMKDRIHKTVPKDSIVGMLMESREDYRIVESAAKGIEQHNPFTWRIESGDFVYLDDISDNAHFTDQVITEWLASFSDEDLAIVVDALFEAIEASGASDATEILSGGKKTFTLLREAARNTSGSTKETLTRAFTLLSEIVLRNFGTDLLSFFAPKSSGH